MDTTCPNCGASGSLREIIYGLPAEPVDETKYAIGGCCISDNDPTIRCIECGWEGEDEKNIPFEDKSIKVAEIKPIADMSDAEIDDYAKQLWGNLTSEGRGNKDGYTKS